MKTQGRHLLASLALLATLFEITPGAAAAAEPANYGTLPDGRIVKSYVLTNTHGLRAVLLDYGATLQSLEVPDRAGRLADVTLGYDTLPGWLGNTSYFGVMVGRYANRIAGGKFTIDGKSYQLATNNDPGGIPCHLHGGPEGFHRKLWAGRARERAGARGVEFTYTSRDGEEGYPGTLTAKVTYWLTDQDELAIECEATTDQRTVVNLAHHTYWNLTGDPKKPILNHELMLAADTMLPVNAGLIPAGNLAPVDGTPFDFRAPRAIGSRIGAADEQLKLGNGYDHCWVLRSGTGTRLAARVHDPESGRVMEFFTDQPGVQFYSGNFLDGTAKGKRGVAYAFRTGLCLESESYPDSPNQPAFPAAVLQPGAAYRHNMLWRFSTR